MRMYLVRHGETVWNSELRYQGQTDVPLSDVGLRQARLVAEVLRERLAEDGERFEHGGEHGGDEHQAIEGAAGTSGPVRLFSSDLSRARMTAEVISAAIGSPVELRPGLREASFGEWEGLSFDILAERYPELWAMWRRDPGRVTIPGGEGRDDFAERVRSSFRAIVEECTGAGLTPGAALTPDATAVVVTHGGVIKTLIADALDLDINAYWKVRSDNGGVSVVDAYPEGLIVSSLNETRHLTPAGLPHTTNRLL